MRSSRQGPLDRDGERRCVVFYDFHRDLAMSKKAEHQAVFLCYMLFEDVVEHEFHKSKYYDATLHRKDGTDFTIEVKEDFMCRRTGNLAVEFESRGKPSGIGVTRATFFIYKLHRPKGFHYLFFRPNALKALIKEKKYSRIVVGGDRGSNTRMYLFKIDVITAIATHSLEMKSE